MASKQTIVFEALSNILSGKSMKAYEKHINDEQLWKTYSSFIILRYLSMSCSESVRNIVLDNYMSLERMPAHIQYKWLLNKIPQQKTGFIRYIK